MHSLNLELQILSSLLQVFNILVEVLLSCSANVLDDVTKKEVEVLVGDKILDFDLTVGVVGWMTD